MSPHILIKNGRVIDPASGFDQTADIAIANGAIVALKDIPNGKLWRGKGCPYCLISGYSDRAAIFEIFSVDDVVREQTINRVGSTVIKQDAIKRGMRTLRQSALRKLAEGVTTFEEVVRVTGI